MLELADDNTLKAISLKISTDVTNFQQLDKGTKLKCANQLFTENKLLRELGEIALDTIEELGEQNDIKDKKITIMESELKEYNCYDQDKINELMSSDPVISTNNRERAKRLLSKTACRKYKPILNNNK